MVLRTIVKHWDEDGEPVLTDLAGWSYFRDHENGWLELSKDHSPESISIRMEQVHSITVLEMPDEGAGHAVDNVVALNPQAQSSRSS